MYLVRLAVLAAALLPFSFAQSIRITAGLTDHQVIQRDGKTANIGFTGTASELDGKSIDARVLNAAGKPVATSSIPVSNGAFTAHIAHVPVGGPYTIELRAPGGNVTVNDVLVGDLWILAGQSNMEGVGDLVDVQKPDPRVHSFTQADDTWVLATEPLHSLPNAVDRVHWGKNIYGAPERLQGNKLKEWQKNRKKGAGLGLPFAVEMVRRTGVPVGLIPCAHGGTSMAQWDPALKKYAGDSLYGSMFRRFQATGGRVTGVLWYQGESDANVEAAAVFEKKFEDFVRSVRADFGEPNLPFYYVQIGRHVSLADPEDWNRVQQAQLTAESKLQNSGMISAIDVDLDDGIHVSTPDLKRLGRRLTNLATHSTKIGPRVESVTYEPATANSGVIRAKFSGVNGKLVADGRINGFVVEDADHQPVQTIYKTRVDEDGSTLLLYTSGKMPLYSTLRYGLGRNPYCNVRDSEDMGLPVFGPVKIKGADVSLDPKDRPVAILDGRPYSQAEMRELLDQYPAIARVQLSKDPKGFLQHHLAVEKTVKLAQAEGVAKDLHYKFDLNQAIFQAYMDYLRGRMTVTPAEQLEFYQQHQDKYASKSFNQVKDEVYGDVLYQKQIKRLDDLFSASDVKILEPDFFQQFKPELPPGK